MDEKATLARINRYADRMVKLIEEDYQLREMEPKMRLAVLYGGFKTYLDQVGREDQKMAWEIVREDYLDASLRLWAGDERYLEMLEDVVASLRGA